MEDAGIKALIIGVSLFVTMLTLSAIILYFNTATSVSKKVSDRVDIVAAYDYIMNSENFSDTLTGVEVRSLINKYAGVESVKINVSILDGANVITYNNINNLDIAHGGWIKVINENAKLISEEKLNIINPIWDCTVDKVENTKETVLNIRLNVKD